MAADWWRRVEELYHTASSFTPAERVSFLDESCGGDHALRIEVESLLAHLTSSDAFMETSAFEVAARLMARGRSAAEMSLTGTTIGGFRVLEKLGEGGMGVVYEAVDSRLGRTVALKFLPETIVANPRALERFEREARAASALNHPNVCTIHSVQNAGGRPFIEMERLQGQTLRERIAGQPLDGDEIVSLGLQMVDGLDAAHANGIIHRDLKPANVFCTDRGFAKILDFGIATFEAAADADPGAVVGTAGYMSPEQASGQPVDSRTDLFSLGALLYEMATGRAAFRGNSSAEIRNRILNDDPTPPRQLNPSLPAGLERIILKALRKKRNLRYQRASELRPDLERLQRRTPHRRRYGVIAAAVFVPLFIGVALWYSRRGAGEMLDANLQVRQLTHNASEDGVRSGAISPDGRYVAYTDSRGIHVQHVETGEMRTVPQSGNLPTDSNWDLTPGWHRDGTGFVVNLLVSEDTARSSVWVVKPSAAPRKIRDHAEALSVSPEGSWIAFATDGNERRYPTVWLMDGDATTARKLFDADTGTSIAGLSWSPDGHRVAYLRVDNTGASVAIETRDLIGGVPSTLFRSTDPEVVQGIAWLRDGRLLYSTGRSARIMSAGTVPCTHWQVRLDNRTGQPLAALAVWPAGCLNASGR